MAFIEPSISPLYHRPPSHFSPLIVPGSYPDSLPVPVFGALNELRFSFYINETNYNTEDLSLVYINGQNSSVVEKLSNVIDNNYVHFTALFPYQQYQIDGLTIAALTNSVGPFSNTTNVAAATLYGPRIIEVS
ncbi:hypothetical protein N7486_009089 [Penicillium sp. IBT 16267x]|nr:hypothetical protein N7486_009089 [Penicillium sp. IBT 16267x]